MGSPLLARRYREGGKLNYRMTATNKDRASTRRYEARAEGIVKKDPAGNLYEEYHRPELALGGKPVTIPVATAELTQILSLDPN
jgi:hypothetical protein